MYVLEMQDGEEIKVTADEMNQQYGFLVFSNDSEQVMGIRAEQVRMWRYEESERRSATYVRKKK